MILLIDNYDSFSYNLFQLIGQFQPDIKVIRNDVTTIEEIQEMNPEAIVISTGPGRPENAGICISVIQKFAGRIPILGVCLGHQAICKAFGGEVGYASHLMHGKQSRLKIAEESPLFQGLTEPVDVARYHSLAAEKNRLPACLKITAQTEDGEIMAVEHREYPVYGLQFHPESVMTPQGAVFIKNFIDRIKK